ncbi:MAG: type III-A CRISPR-associated protein Csm2 [Bacteroidota bacterium]
MAVAFNNVDGTKKAASWIEKGLTPEAITFAEAFGKELTGRKGKSSYRGPFEALTTSQIRNIFGEVRRIEMKGYDERALLMLKPRLMYAVQRNPTAGSKDFQRVITTALDAVFAGATAEQKADRFRNFADFFEAILAYHRAYGGK